MYKAAILSILLMATSTAAQAECDGIGCEEATDLYETLDDNIVVDIVDDTDDDSGQSMDDVMQEEAPTFEDNDVFD